jgi:hypothetical protein
MSLTCCNDQQHLSIILIVLYIVLILKLWRVALLHPFKILYVPGPTGYQRDMLTTKLTLPLSMHRSAFLHELGHVVACWLTCGRVTSMEVNPNEGGATKTSGGIQWIILIAVRILQRLNHFSNLLSDQRTTPVIVGLRELSGLRHGAHRCQVRTRRWLPHGALV